MQKNRSSCRIFLQLFFFNYIFSRWGNCCTSFLMCFLSKRSPLLSSLCSFEFFTCQQRLLHSQEIRKIMDYLTISYLSNNIFSLFDLYLLQRQNRAYRCTTIPPTLAHSIDPTTFQQGQDYGRAKTQHLIWTSIKKIVESNVVFMSSWSVKLWKWSVLPAVYQQGSFAHCAAFCALGEVVNTLLDLPQDYYFHFVVEEKFGFNKLSVREWIKDHVKSFLLKTCV